MEVILKTVGLGKSFSLGGKMQHVLVNVDLELYKEDFTVIMGSSGSGKSTLLYSLSGMDKPSMGDIIYTVGDKEENISGYNNDKLALFRRKNLGFVFQDICLNNNMSVMDNVLSAGYLANKNRKAVIAKAKELFEKVAMETTLFKKFPNQLSGGEAQRVGLVRALINSPALLFADEPTGALNSGTSIMVLDLLNKFHEDGQSILMVTHDIKSALRGSRILYLKDGKIVDELRLGDYDGDVTGRLEQLQAFLDKMGW